MPDPVPWTFAPGGGYSEELAWLTDVLEAPTGGTQHRRLRTSPRTTIRFDALESGASRRWLDAQLRAHGAGRWWVPVAIDARQLGSAVSAAATVLPAAVDGARFVAGGRVLVLGGNPRAFEVRTIQTVGASSITLTAGLDQGWPAGTLLLPLRAGRLAEVPQVARFTADDSALVPLRFELDEPLDTAAAMPGATYRSYPVFDAFAPVWTSDPVWSPERRVELVDDDIATPLAVDLAGVGLGKTVMSYAADTQASVESFRAALFALAGRWSPVWVPTWARDLRVVGIGDGFSPGGPTNIVDVEGPILSPWPLDPNHRDIRIELFDGSAFYSRIATVEALTSTVDRLTLDAEIPAAFGPGDIMLASFLVLSTQDTDTDILNYFDQQTMLCEITWRELAHGL